MSPSSPPSPHPSHVVVDRDADCCGCVSRAGSAFAGEPGGWVMSDMGLERVARPPGSPGRAHFALGFYMRGLSATILLHALARNSLGNQIALLGSLYADDLEILDHGVCEEFLAEFGEQLLRRRHIASVEFHLEELALAHAPDRLIAE